MSGWRLFSNWTLYLDVPIPFTRRVLILDIGRFGTVGWRYKREGSHD